MPTPIAGSSSGTVQTITEAREKVGSGVSEEVKFQCPKEYIRDISSYDWSNMEVARPE